MPPKKNKPDPLSVETKEYLVFDPDDVKETVEIEEKPKPTIEQIETIEKKGRIIKKRAVKKPTKRKSTKKTTKKNTSRKTTNKSTSGKNKAVNEHIKLKKEGYVLVITEKPQAAGKIAAALAEGNDDKISKPGGVSYYELNRKGKNIIVACAVGHLFSVSQNIKGADYPIFDIDWYPNSEVNKKDFTKKYYTVIKNLIKGASEIVVATDFDVEGEVIGYNVVRFIAGQNDAKRMKFSSLTAKEIQDSYDKRLPTIEWGQAIAGETRHFLDWLYGINLSRALMKSIRSVGKFKIMSIGRVQGPALNLIVQKEKQIQAFKPTPYWQVFLTVNDCKNKLEVKHNKDITKKEELEKFKKLEGNEAEATTKKTKQTIKPPAPFDLTSLQTESYKFHGLTPSQTLQIAQKLYLAGVISYPRTSSQKIPEAMKPLEILKQLKKRFGDLVEHATQKKPIEGNKSDPAHPAIIPTGNNTKLEDQDAKIYNLIAKRFISCFCDNAELENKRVEVTVDIDSKKYKFAAKGLEVLKSGWMKVYPVKMEERELKDMNGKVKIEEVKIEEKETKPPKRYSPASIVTELEKRNLGTKATRANILETLYNRNYIQDKSIKATELGIRLIDSLDKHSPIIIDEKLTREIEKDMDIIRSSKNDLEKKQDQIIKKAQESLTKISNDFKKKEQQIGKELVDANQALMDLERENNKLGKKCPNCDEGELTIKFTPRFRSYFIACTAYPDCRQTYSLPKGLIKNEAKKECEECGWPMILRIMQGKRPWVFCFNPDCASRQKKEEEPIPDNERVISE
jgi:DNA topoisomerase I